MTNVTSSHKMLMESQHSYHGTFSPLAEMPRTHQVSLTLHQIAPRWASVLARTPKTDKIRFKVRGATLDISRLKLCVVGEAHGFSDGYGTCPECYQASCEFASLLRDKPSQRKPQLDAFVEHFNSKHL